MSRSFKKNPGWKDRPANKKYWKRQASKAVRHRVAVDNFSAYKLIYDRYNICDYNFRYYSRGEARRECPSYGDKIYQSWIK